MSAHSTTKKADNNPAPHRFGDSVPSATPLAASVQTITSRCAASGGVLLRRKANGWEVLASTGCAALRLPVGMAMDEANTPSLFQDHSGTPNDTYADMPATPDPFMSAMGPMTNWDWAVCPLVESGKLLGSLYLFSDWEHPFTSAQVAMATMGADMLAHNMATPPAPAVQAGTTTDELKTAISLINHDLRSPLNAILGFAELLQSRNSDPDTVARYASIMATGGNSMVSMIDSVVTLMRAILGAIEWRQADTSVAMSLYGLNVEGGPQGNVCWDTEMMHRALSALAQYTGASNTDRLVVMVSTSHVHITVGSSEDAAVPLDHTLASIPVQMARHIIERHDGSIHTNTTGTWFQILLPKQPSWADQAER